MTRLNVRTLFPLLVFCLSLFPSVGSARTLEEVSCEEAKLERLIHRMATNGSGDNLFLWATAPDHYNGLATFPRFAFGPDGLTRDDRQLGFDLELHRMADLLNPHRPLLPQAVLARNDLNTTFTNAPSFENPRVDLKLELASEVVDPQAPTQGLVITSQSGIPTGAASGAGRALLAENLFERCLGEENSALDLQVFEILARTLRISATLLEPFPGQGGDLYKVIFFRDAEPLTYRAKVFLYSTIDGEYSEASIQLRLRMNLDSDGRLGPGRIEALPWCLEGASPPCSNLINPSSAVVVAPPMFAGHEIQTEAQFQSGAFLNIWFEGSSDNVLTDDVPWPDLLNGTAWDRPLGLP